MRTPGFDKGFSFFFLLRLLAQLAFSGHDRQAKLLFQIDLVLLRVKTFVKTARIERWETLLGLDHHVYRDLIISQVLHHFVVQDELVLIFHYTYLDPEFHRNTCLTLADPLRVRLEYGEDFLSVRDDLSFDHTSLDLINLAFCVRYEALECELSASRHSISHKHGSRQSSEDMDEKSLRGANLAGNLDARFFLYPVEDGFDGLAHLRDSA